MNTRKTLYTLGPIAGLIAVYGLFAVLAPEGFTSAANLITIARQTTIVGIAALGMTMVIIAGGIDLSIGSVIALVTVVIATLLNKGVGPVVAAGCGVLTGVVCGGLTGALVTGLRITPFIVTLGMLLTVRGVAKGIANDMKVDAPATWLNQILAAPTPDTRWMLVPPGVWLMVLLAILMGVFLNHMRLGRHLFATGANEHATRLCGIAVQRVKLAVYTLSGALVGIAGLMQFSRLTVGDPTVATGLELDAIAAVVIGGGSLSGGEGSVIGSLVGAFIMTVIRSGCSQMGLPNWVQGIVTGGIIVGAVALDRLRHPQSP